MNAVATQIFVALCVYLIAYLKFVSRSHFGIQAILRLLQINLFVRRPIEQFLRKPAADPPSPQTAFQLRIA
jgi:putative transposase